MNIITQLGWTLVLQSLNPQSCQAASSECRPHAIPHVTKHETESGWKSGYYGAILSGKEDCCHET